jgi:hypothetical protein
MVVSVSAATLAAFAILCLLLPFRVLADSEAMPWAWMKTSANGRYCFKMVPPKWHLKGDAVVTDRKAYGVVYRLADDGQLVELWRTSDWYSFEVYLSDDGTHLVRIGPWARDQEKHTDLAVAFYDRGRLLKEYQVRELLKAPDKAVNSVSHYEWRPVRQSKPTGFKDDGFHLVMADHTSYSFDLATGAITTVEQDDKARNFHEVRAEEKDADAQRGKDLLEKWEGKESFEKLFEISKASAGEGKIMGVYFEGPEWRADLKPKALPRANCLVEAVFPIVDGQRINTSISPEETRDAFKKAMEHPFVASRFESKAASGIRIRVTGDRFHWDTPELQKMLKQVTGQEPAADALRNWAYCILDEKDHHYTSFYFNTATGELIYKDESKWPREPILLDRAGTRIKPGGGSGK